MIEFIQNLSRIKNQQGPWNEKSLSERVQILEEVFALMRKEFRSKEVSETPWTKAGSPWDWKRGEMWWRSFLKEPTRFLRSSPEATGLHCLIFEGRSSIHSIWNSIAKSLLAGNAVIFFGYQIPEATKASWQRAFQSIFQKFPMLPIRIFFGEDEFLEVICGHPSVQAVSFYGTSQLAEKILRTPTIVQKKLQITSGVHNAALILSDADLSLAASRLAPLILFNDPTWPLSIAEIFVLESHLETFTQMLLAEVSRLRADLVESALETERVTSTLSAASEIRKRLQSEPGRYLPEFEREGLFVVQDFSHCSPLHQEALIDPILFIQPVKYAHEMVKWVRALDHGSIAYVFGSIEKILKFAVQLPVSQVLANGQLEELSDFPIGRGRSFFGIGDQNFDGVFYSQSRKIDGLS